MGSAWPIVYFFPFHPTLRAKKPTLARNTTSHHATRPQVMQSHLWTLGVFLDIRVAGRNPDSL